MNDTIDLIELASGFVISLTIGLLGYWRGALKSGGVVGAVITGTLIFGLGGWEWGVKPPRVFSPPRFYLFPPTAL